MDGAWRYGSVLRLFLLGIKALFVGLALKCEKPRLKNNQGYASVVLFNFSKMITFCFCKLRNFNGFLVTNLLLVMLILCRF